jgi:GR25 family glycosyltransferase involved in LPS biosynthesis
MHILYINLDSRTDRRQNIERQFHRHKLSAHRISAVTKYHVQHALNRPDPLQIDARIRTNLLMNSKTSSFDLDGWGAVACFESHRKAWTYCLEQGWDSCWIFEDDALIHKVEEIQVTADLPLVWLGLRGNVQRQVEPGLPYPLLKYTRQCFGAHAYCIHASLLQTLLWNTLVPMSLSVDYFILEYCFAHSIRAGIVDFCSTQEFLSFSDIEHFPLQQNTTKRNFFLLGLLIGLTLSLLMQYI